jgi:hypothetical protein
VYGRCVLVLKDIPSTLLHNVSVTPFGLANLLRDKLAANARLAIEQEQCRFLEINTWDGRTWREQFAIFYDYYLASDPDRYLSPNPDKNSPSKPPGRFRAFYGERVWPDDISDYRAWTIELRLAAELRLEEISTNECELYLPPSILMYWGNKVDKRLSGSVSHLKKRITIREEENAVVEAAVAIKRRLQPEWRRPSKSP